MQRLHRPLGWLKFELSGDDCSPTFGLLSLSYSIDAIELLQLHQQKTAADCNETNGSAEKNGYL